MTSTYREHDVVIVRTLLRPNRDVTGSDNAARQPRIGDQGASVQVLDASRRLVECVESSGRTAWIAEFHIDELSPPLDHWRFELDEISAGVYRAMKRRSTQIEFPHRVAGD